MWLLRFLNLIVVWLLGFSAWGSIYVVANVFQLHCYGFARVFSMISRVLLCSW